MSRLSLALALLVAGRVVGAGDPAAALDALVEKHRLGSMAYYYMGTGSEENEDVMTSVILGNSLLTGRGVPAAGEYEVKMQRP